MLGLVFLSSCAGAIPAPPWQLEPQGVAQVAAPEPAPARAYAFPDAPGAPRQIEGPPIGLTASDGTGLRLAELEARAIVEEPLAFTELHLVFDNPEDRRLEGTFSITLPDGAAISRFAMRVGEGWQEGEVVEKKAAREAYEDFLHRRQDPALLEQAGGNQFSARVFPIPPRGRKELIVSYSQELPRGRPYVLPLRGLPELGKLDVSVTLGGQRAPVEELRRAAFTPTADFQLDARHLKGGPGLRSGNLVLARVTPIGTALPDPLGATLVLVDTSASRALGFEEQLALVDRLVRRLAESAGPDTPLTVACFDQTTDPVFEGSAGAWGDGEVRRVRERQAFGASNLERALGWAEAHAAARGTKRVILVGDGVATAGVTDTGALALRAAKLGAAGVERLDAVAVGGIRDENALRRLVNAGLPRDGVVADGAIGVDAITRKLGQATRSGLAVNVEGARWRWPERLDGVQPGDETLVYADVPEGLPVRVSVGSAAGEALELTPVARPLLERSWAKAKISSLVDRKGGLEASPELVREVVALSTAYRVLSPYTSLLVLETDQDFARFQLDRKALASILTVDGGRLAVAGRRPPSARNAQDDARLAAITRAVASQRPSSAPLLAPPPPAAAEPVVQAAAAPRRASASHAALGASHGSGGLSLSGIGEGGGGRGEGIGLGSIGSVGHGRAAGSASGVGGGVVSGSMAGASVSGAGTGAGFGSGHGGLAGTHRAAPPQVRMGATAVSGRVPPEVIQRIVHLNFGRMRACYEEGLRRNPHAAGRLGVQFTIMPDGSVSRVSTTGADEVGAGVAACVVRAMEALSFPPPEGGTVTVSYPFVFSPADGASTPAPDHLPAMNTPPPPPPPPSAPPKPPHIEPYTGRFKTVMDQIGAGGSGMAVASAYAWHREQPGDVMALVALGEALEASGATTTAARAYGSIVDLFPARADLRRFAGQRMERLAGAVGLDPAIDTFEKAEEERPDHPESHRLVAFAKLRRGQLAEAFAAGVRGVQQHYPGGRFRGVDQILREDLGLIAAAWIKAEPERREEIMSKLAAAGGKVEDAPSLRFVLSWETDANDVDFHIEDAEGGHAFYSDPVLRSGGKLYADVTTGYGPECFTIRLPREERSALYRLQAHYYSRGPMGYGMGKLEIIDHDGKGGLTFEERPFVVMADHAYVDLGTVTR
jgi:hypothetical protein